MLIVLGGPRLAIVLLSQLGEALVPVVRQLPVEHLAQTEFPQQELFVAIACSCCRYRPLLPPLMLLSWLCFYYVCVVQLVVCGLVMAALVLAAGRHEVVKP